VSGPRWSARFTVACRSDVSAEHLLAALGPEAAREVPKTSAVLARPAPAVVEISVAAPDAGSLRAAANTYLGWVDLAGSAEAVARRAGPPSSVPKPLSP
jgi:tRNA threonylcarbamoyladenosine modification (KEOPS) complex  Pcc1 subunit